MALVESFSGIRGIYGKDLTGSICIKYAYAYQTFLKEKLRKRNIAIVMGMDTRPSGSAIKSSILSILDCNFIDIGIAPTPAVEFAVRHFKADGGIIITASHNEPYWNGFKFLVKDGSILSQNEMNLVIRNFGSFRDFHKLQERKVLEKNSEAIKKYAEFVFDIVGNESLDEIKASGQKIVFDPNGGAGIIAKRILEQAGVKIIGVNMDFGDFKRAVEPNEDSMIYLKSTIDESGADFAAGFDCDADRVEILMKDSKLLSGNYILALVVHKILSSSKNPRGKFVVVNDATSNVVRDVAEKFGAKIKEVEVGETNVVQEMKRLKAIVGGEGSSGGAIIPPSKCRDGILTLLTILSIIAKKQKPLESIIDELPQYYTLRRKIEFEKPKHNSIKKYIKNYYSNKGFEIRETGDIRGGLKIITGKNSYVWFRASKTEGNVFRIITDSDKKTQAENLMEEAVKVFEGANGSTLVS